MQLPLLDVMEVDTLHLVPDDDAPLLGAQDLAQRWGLTRQRIHQLLAEDDRMPRGQRIGGGLKRKGERVWTLAEIEAYEHVSGRRKVGGDVTDA